MMMVSQIKELEVALQELDTLKIGKKCYQRLGQVHFREKRDHIIQTTRTALSNCQSQRFELGQKINHNGTN